MLLISALVGFAVTAGIGTALAALYQKGKLSMNMAYAHGLFAVISLLLLVVAAAQGTLTAYGMAALILFVLAALGGAVLYTSHLKKGALPKPLIAIHAAAAVLAFLLLLVGAVR